MHYNRTNFVPNGFAVRLLKAMQGALTDGYAHYVDNRRGQRWLRVNVVSSEGSDNGYAFQFLADSGQEVGHLLLQALFSWSPEVEREFSGLVNELYTRKEHPLITARRVVLDEEPESNPYRQLFPVETSGSIRWMKSTIEYLSVACMGLIGGCAYSVAREVLPAGFLP